MPDSNSTQEKKTKQIHIAEINAHEMACRIAEAIMYIERPTGLSAEQALNIIRETEDNFFVETCYRAATAAGEYLEEAINNRQRMQ